METAFNNDNTVVVMSPKYVCAGREDVASEHESLGAK